MAKTLDELRQSPHVGRPERTVPVCLAAPLLAEIEAKDDELRQLIADETRSNSRNRLGSKTSKARALAEEIDKLSAEMNEHVVQVRLRAKPQGEWRRWCAEHPAREDNKFDARQFAGLCNGDDLVAAVGEYVVAVNEKPLADGDWQFVADNASDGDHLAMARIVAAMHENQVDVPKSRVALLDDLRSESGSE